MLSTEERWAALRRLGGIRSKFARIRLAFRRIRNCLPQESPSQNDIVDAILTAPFRQGGLWCAARQKVKLQFDRSYGRAGPKDAMGSPGCVTHSLRRLAAKLQFVFPAG